MTSKILKTTVGIILAASSLNAADENKATDTTPPNWWQKGSYEYPETDKLLIHLEGNVGYSKKSGNEEDENVKIGASAKIRKGHFGLSISYTKLREDRVAYDDKSTVVPTTSLRDDYQVNTILGYDVNKDFYVNAGHENSRDITFEIYNQNTYYVGAGYRILTLDKHKASLFAAVGTDEISFGRYPMLPSGKTDGLYFQGDYLWIVKPGLFLSTGYKYLKADMDYRDTSTFTAKATVAINQYVSLVVGYLDDYIEAQETVNRHQHDKMIFTQIQFQY